MTSLMEQLIRKMGLQDEPKILEKTTELIRLLDLRSTNIGATLNDYAKIVLCIDLAAVFLGIAFDQVNALKLSGLRKTQYANNKRMLEKLLDLNKLVGVNDICVKLGLNDIAKRATDLLELYTDSVQNEAADIDITHPQYPAMAVFQACKLTRKQISKTKIMSFSHLRPSQWMQLEQRWDKIIANNYSEKKNAKCTEGEGGKITKTADQEKVSPKATKRGHTGSVEEYEVWKRRMLEQSRLQLSLQNLNTKDDKENMVTMEI